MLFRRREFELGELSRKFLTPLHEARSPSALYPMVLKAAVESMNACGGSLVICHGNDFEVKECLGWKSFSFRKEECLPFIQWLRKHRQTVTRKEIVEDHDYASVKAAGLHFFVQFQAEACLPLFIHHDLIGFINLGGRQETGDYHTGARDVLEWLGSQFSFALSAARLQEERQQQTKIIRQYKDLKGQILSNLSHELRTPLTSIIGFAELLDEEVDGALSEGQRGHVKQILDGGERLLAVLSMLVDLAKLEAGSQSLNVRQFHFPLFFLGLQQMHLRFLRWCMKQVISVMAVIGCLILRIEFYHFQQQGILHSSKQLVLLVLLHRINFLHH